jgi:SAM-dependent methyltransferase
MVRDNYKPDKRLNYDKNKYINEWQKDSDYFLEQGYYNLMANCLFEKINPEIVLEIGCGNGNGIIELLKNKNIKNIISIEENECCIDFASRKIEAEGIFVKKIIRNNPTFIKGEVYVNQYSEINEFELSKVNIIQGDILYDEIIKQYIKNKKFDVVICWLLGTHESTQANLEYINAGVKDNKTFRLLVQNCIYELSDIILKENGFLHIVDRGEIPYNKEIMEQYISCHKDQASVTNLKIVEDIKFLEYKPLDNGIRMINSSFPSHERKSTPKGTAFISVLSKK